MSGSTISNDQFNTMVQEAELYEAQGLYSHAKEIYRKILAEYADLPEAAEAEAILKKNKQKLR